MNKRTKQENQSRGTRHSITCTRCISFVCSSVPCLKAGPDDFSMSSGGLKIFWGRFKMALHKKHRLLIALGNNNDVYGIFCFHWEEM